MQKYLCDRCGMDGAGRVIISVAVSAPLKSPRDDLKSDRDLCPDCYDKTQAVLAALLKL